MKKSEIHEPIAGGCSTTGKIPLPVPGHPVPDRVLSASGATFEDECNRVWLDFDMALGSVIWGHGRKEFGDAIRDALIQCGSPSVPSVKELQAARSLLSRLSSYEQLRFFKSGSDACSAAIRIARAGTRRPSIATDGYHGWHDWSVAWAYPDDSATLGILDTVKSAVQFLNPSDGLRRAQQIILGSADHLAAVMIRPEAWPSQAIADFVAICKRTGTILIFDEVTSHFKYGRHGVAGKLGIWPDLLCISKGLANGLPLSALLGPETLMRHAVSARISTTYASESTALAGLLVGERLLSNSKHWPSWQTAMERVVENVHQILGAANLLRKIEVVTHPGFFSIQSVGVSFRNDPFRYHVVGCLADRNIFTRGWFHGSDSHRSEHWEALDEALKDALCRWAERDAH